jgi:hypothetical protein
MYKKFSKSVLCFVFLSVLCFVLTSVLVVGATFENPFDNKKCFSMFEMWKEFSNILQNMHLHFSLSLVVYQTLGDKDKILERLRQKECYETFSKYYCIEEAAINKFIIVSFKYFCSWWYPLIFSSLHCKISS